MGALCSAVLSWVKRRRCSECCLSSAYIATIALRWVIDYYDDAAAGIISERERERERAVIAARALRRVWPKWNGSDVTGRRVGSASTCIIVQYIARLWRHFSAGNVSAAIISCMFLSIDHTQCWSAPVYSTALLLIYQTNEMIAYRNLPVRTFH